MLKAIPCPRGRRGGSGDGFAGGRETASVAFDDSDRARGSELRGDAHLLQLPRGTLAAHQDQ